MPPEGVTEALAADEGDKAPLMGVDEAERVDLVVGPEQGMRRSIYNRPVPIKDAVKVLVFLDMLSVALVVPLLSSYFRDLNIRCPTVGMEGIEGCSRSLYVAFETSAYLTATYVPDTSIYFRYIHVREVDIRRHFFPFRIIALSLTVSRLECPLRSCS